MTFKHSLNFGGVDSADYGIWLTGSGTFSAPERDIEFVPVPGRNGDLAIDNGRWNNIEVVYPANIPNDFDNRMAAFRAELCRKRGYQRLEDTYHPDEYRMGVFSAGIDPEMTPLNRGGDFNLVFNCKPQRYLKSGDVPLQFMPWVPTTYRSQYIPAYGETVRFETHCPASDTLTVRFTTFNNSATQVRTTTFDVVDGDYTVIGLQSGDFFWRIEIESGITDEEETHLLLDFDLNYFTSGITHVSAWFGQYFELKNPTGYASKPLMEVWADLMPYTVWENYINGAEDYYYEFHTNSTGQLRFWMDCEMQYLYDIQKNNLTSKLFLNTTGSGIGEGMVFPVLGEEDIKLNMSYTMSDPETGLGIINIYPRWYRL